jgi:lipid A oxidase
MPASAVARAALIACAAVLLLAAPAPAQTTFSLYGGWQGAGTGTVRGRVADGSRFDFRAGWEGRSLEGAPYYGLRLTRWLGGTHPDWGLALDFVHSKLYADEATLARSGFPRLEFTHGLNVLSLNAMRRFPQPGRLTPYLGAGAGITIPHVEITTPAGARALEYQLGGPALVAMAGASWRVAGRLSFFAEWRVDYVWLDVRTGGGGRLKTDTLVNAANVGLSLDF